MRADPAVITCDDENALMVAAKGRRPNSFSTNGPEFATKRMVAAFSVIMAGRGSRAVQPPGTARWAMIRLTADAGAVSLRQIREG